MKLFVQNTLSRNKDVFEPRSGGAEVKLFTCGPSVYNLPHIGNYRTYLYEDVLERTLDALGYDVRRVLNFTDVEDKAVAEARKRGLTDLTELTRPNEEQFFKDAESLRILIPEEIPRSSESVGQAVHLIRVLLEKGHAYWHHGNVFFDPLTCTDFGRLYGLDMSHWPKKKIRFHKDTYPGQRWNLGDFILWHGGEKDDPFVWETEIGSGRPAWNIQDPSMISQTLGFELDLCCGGVDNLYRHHDYNMAIMESVSGSTLAPFWLHGEHLLVDGVKMSKSKGNIVYPENLYSKGWSSDFLRFFLLSAHYRSTLNLSSSSIDAAWSMFSRLRSLVDAFRNRPGRLEHIDSSEISTWAQNLLHGAFVHLGDDLDVVSAVTFVIKSLEHALAMMQDGQLSQEDQDSMFSSLVMLDHVLGFAFPKEIES